MDTGARLAIFAIVEQEPWGKSKSRPDGKSIEKQQDMEVLGVDLSLSVSVKDRFIVHPHVMLNACRSLSWPDNSFRPRSRVAQLRPGPVLLCTPCGGRSD